MNVFFLAVFMIFQSGQHIARKVNEQPVIDGMASETFWREATWYPIDQLWLGSPYEEEDFSGRFKVAWDSDHLYLLVEVQDDTLIDIHEDGLEKYWDDDCVEVFLDEDDSDGEHTYSYNAFAYHIGIDYSAVDYGPEGPLYLNDHVKTARTKDGDKYIWEHRFTVYDDTFDHTKENTPVKLSAGKRMGFAVAYCDNDSSAQRENFIGSVFVPGEDKNRGYIDAGIFGELKLIE